MSSKVSTSGSVKWPSSTPKKLFTPGPLSCTMSVKEAMLRDFGSRDEEFTAVIGEVRRGFLKLAGLSEKEWTVVLLQGCGTYSVEAALHTACPRDEKAQVLVLSNGAYGQRLVQLCKVAALKHDVLDFGEAQCYDMALVEQHLKKHLNAYSAVIAVHLETSCGLVNPVESLAKLVRSYQPSAKFIVDAMSSFLAVPIDPTNIDFIVTSANKCVQGVPGFGVVLVQTVLLETCQGNARTLSLDLCAQHKGFETQSQFRFTPPTHVLLAAQQAIKELEEEGGPTVRAARYRANAAVLMEGMERMGFSTLLPREHLCPVITAFLCPKHPAFSFTALYRKLSNLGQVIYPGKVTRADCFRIGCIGDLQPDDLKHLVKCVEKVMNEMGVPLPLPSS